MVRYVTCKKCKWVSVGYSKDFVVNEINEFNNYYDTLDEETQDHFSGRSSLENYKCINCNGKRFKIASTKDIERVANRTLCSVVFEE